VQTLISSFYGFQIHGLTTVDLVQNDFAFCCWSEAGLAKQSHRSDRGAFWLSSSVVTVVKTNSSKGHQLKRRMLSAKILILLTSQKRCG